MSYGFVKLVAHAAMGVWRKPWLKSFSSDCYWDGFIRSFHGLPDMKRRQNTSQGDSIPECDEHTRKVRRSRLRANLLMAKTFAACSLRFRCFWVPWLQDAPELYGKTMRLELSWLAVNLSLEELSRSL